MLIQQARQRRGWTQTELGERLGVGRRSVTNWEAGDVPPGRVSEIGQVLGVEFVQVGAGDWAVLDQSSGSNGSPAVVHTADHILDLGGALDGISDPVERQAILTGALAAALRIAAEIRSRQH